MRARYALLLLSVMAPQALCAEAGSDCTDKTRLTRSQMCYDDTVVDCASPGNNSQFRACLDQQYRRADAELNQLYQRILKQLNGPEKSNLRSRLVQGQRAWLKYREADCAIEEELLHATRAVLTAVAECEIELNRSRIRVLRQRFPAGK